MTTKKQTRKELDWKGGFKVLAWGFITLLILLLIIISNRQDLQQENAQLKEQLSLRYYCFDNGDILKINSWDGASYRTINLFDNNGVFEELNSYGLNISECFDRNFMNKYDICDLTNISSPIFQIFIKENCEVLK